MMNQVEYSRERTITANEFIDLLQRSSLAERRPVEDLDCISGMLEHSNLLVTAWVEDKLVGIARSVTDFHYACYLSDLAVDKNFQNQGIGRGLQQETQSCLGPRCKLILISAPAANTYYPRLGYEKVDRCWVLPREQGVKAIV